MPDQIYVFIDNSFLYVQGYKHVQNVANLPADKRPYVDYPALHKYLETQGDLKRIVVVGSNLPGSMTAKCQSLGFEVFTLPKYPDFKTGTPKKGSITRYVGRLQKPSSRTRIPCPTRR